MSLLAKHRNKLLRIAYITPEFVTEDYFSGGLANYLGRIAVSLAERGHDVHVITRAKKNQRHEFRGVTVHRVVPLWDKHMVLDHVDPLIPRKLYNMYQDVKAAWCLWRRWLAISRRETFDIVQIPNVNAAGLFFRLERRCPVVARLSTHPPTWSKSAGVVSTPLVRLRWLLERWSVSGAGAFYAPSSYVADKTMDDYLIPKVEVVESPFLQEVLLSDPSEYEKLLKGREYVLFFGRMNRMKGIHILADALPHVLAKSPDMHMLFIGEDPGTTSGGGLRDYVLAQAVGYQDRIHFLSALRHEKLYPIIQSARFVVLPSLVDNLPNTCLEAMGLGKVVIATTGSSFEQLIKDGESGVLVNPGDADALAAGMVEVWSWTAEKRAAIGAAARVRVAELHPDQAIPRLIQFYDEAINRFDQQKKGILQRSVAKTPDSAGEASVTPNQHG